jgi:peptidoglycan hydrolase-like protein with peptidoglycan-binding domain
VCRARDIDASDLDLAAAVERARADAWADPSHPLRGGGYIIFAGKITKPDFSGWARYTGTNPHVLMAHFSVSVDPARFDAREPWGIFTTARRPAPPRPRPAPAPAVERSELNTRWLERGPGHYKPGDPRHQATRNVQRRLKTRFPAYARHLVVDGVYGPATEAAVREFQRRKHLEVTGVAGPLTLSRLGL